jgi:hypothetical protein
MGRAARNGNFVAACNDGVLRRCRLVEAEEVGFAVDSPLEEDGFEPLVPGERAVVHGIDSPAQIIKPDRLTWPGSGGSSVPVQS